MDEDGSGVALGSLGGRWVGGWEEYFVSGRHVLRPSVRASPSPLLPFPPDTDTKDRMTAAAEGGSVVVGAAPGLASTHPSPSPSTLGDLGTNVTEGQHRAARSASSASRGYR